VKTKNEKEHNTFVHIDDNTFVCKTPTLYCFDLKDPKKRRLFKTHAILI